MGLCLPIPGAVPRLWQNHILLPLGAPHHTNAHKCTNGAQLESQNLHRGQHTHKNYEIKPGCVGETYALVRALKDRTGCNAIGIHLHGGKNIRGLRWEFFSDLPVNVYENACKSFKKNKFLSLDRTGYDEYFVIQGNIKIEFDAFNNLDEEASMAKIRNAFCKGAEGKKKSRTIASRIVEIIS